MRRAGWLSLLLIGALGVRGRAAAAQPADAAAESAPSPATQKLFDEARGLFDRGLYAEAATVFARLHIQTSDPAVLYPLGQSQRLAGQCAAALSSYRQFIAAEPELRRRADSAAPGTGLKRLTGDLMYARGRVLEMRICQTRPRLTAARQAAQRGLAAGDSATAVAALQPVWDEDHDPTALVDLAQLHQARNDCAAATRSLDQAIEELTPAEALRAAGAPGSDLAEALGTLERARQARRDLVCDAAAPVAPVAPPATAVMTSPPATVAPLVSPVAPAVSLDATRPASRSAPRWPLLVAAAGGAMAGAGMVSFFLAKSAKQEVESVLREREWDRERDDHLITRFDRYRVTGIVLTTTGVAVAGAAVVYHFLYRSPDRMALIPVLQVARGDAALGFRGLF